MDALTKAPVPSSLSAPWASRAPGGSRGFTLVEVLVAAAVTVVALLGIAALQAKLQLSDVDAYQRTQASLLMQDMADRIATNRDNAASYATGTAGALTPLGTGHAAAADCTSQATTALRDTCEWSKLLQGVAEQVVVGGTATQIGAMVGARGCVEEIGNDSYLISVVWQGLTPLSAPPSGIVCGQNLYNDSNANAPCVNDLCRRAVATIVRIGIMD